MSGGGEELTVVEAARVAEVSPTTLMRRIQEGALPAERAEHGWRLKKSVVLEFGPSLRKRAARPAAEREASRGALAAQCFPLFTCGTPLDEVVVKLEADPAAVLAAFEAWCRLREVTARWLTPAPAVPTPGPTFDHEPRPGVDEDWCCEGHAAAARMEASKKEST